MRRDAPAPPREGCSPAGTGYTVAGQGEAVILIHGVGMRRGVWAPQIDALARTHQVIAYDMLGHGDSRLPPEQPTLADYAEQLHELLAHLGVPHASVAGHSMGALVALEFALRHPARTQRVAALNAVYQRTPAQREAVTQRAAALREAGTPGGVEATLTRWFGDPVPEALQAFAQLAGEYLVGVEPQGYARTYQLFARSDREHVGRLDALTMPTLFLTGEEDANSSPAMSAAMAQAVPGSTLTVIPQARHMMTLTHVPQVNAALLQWLARPAA